MQTATTASRLVFRCRVVRGVEYYIAELDGQWLTQAMSETACRQQAANQIRKLGRN